jgi:hypothetical protein
MRRIVLPGLLLIVAGCASYTQQQVTNPCSVAPPSQGFACVDADLEASPDPVHVVGGKFLHVFFKSGSHELAIASEVFEHTGHEGGHAWAQVKNDAIVGKQYKYTILDVTTGKVKDPEVMIDPAQ